MEAGPLAPLPFGRRTLPPVAPVARDETSRRLTFFSLCALRRCRRPRRALRLTEGRAVSAGKRAAFALFYGPLHYLLVRNRSRAAGGDDRLTDAGRSWMRHGRIGCGVGAGCRLPDRRRRPSSVGARRSGACVSSFRPSRGPVRTMSRRSRCRNLQSCCSRRSPSTSCRTRPARSCWSGWSSARRGATTCSSSNRSPDWRPDGGTNGAISLWPPVDVAMNGASGSICRRLSRSSIARPGWTIAS